MKELKYSDENLPDNAPKNFNLQAPSEIRFRQSKFRTLDKKSFRNTIYKKVKHISRMTVAPMSLLGVAKRNSHLSSKRKSTLNSKDEVIEKLLKEKKILEMEKLFLAKKLEDLSTKVDTLLSNF
jgi:hypothetical protein